MLRLLSITIFLYGLLGLGAVLVTYQNILQSELSSDLKSGEVRLLEVTSRLKGQLDVYRTLANLIGDDLKWHEAVENYKNHDEGLPRALTVLALKYGAAQIDIIDHEGYVRASSHRNEKNFQHDLFLIEAAKQRRLGYQIAVEDDHRWVRFSHHLITNSSKSRYAVVVSVQLASLEFEWPMNPEPVVLFDQEGISISANRPRLLMLSRQPIHQGGNFPLRQTTALADVPLWEYTPIDQPSIEVQLLEREVPLLAMRGVILLDTQSARSTAKLGASLAIALVIVFGLVGAVFVQQRRRLQMESQHSAILESRVETRTQELRLVQDALIKTSNLAALGRLSAGISHEVNQPLAAILNFAENGKRLIEIERVGEASGNFSHIADQARRITRIISNLRAFAKQENIPMDRVNLVLVIRDAMQLVRQDVQDAQVELNAILPEKSVYVMAGRIRLEQVLLNLVSNALDAMQGVDYKKLEISLSVIDDQAVLTVEDSGVGVKNPSQMFEPFYTTKELGASKGLGLGLALSFGIISSFSGRLSCKNIKQGAQFTIQLPLAKGCEC